jgi:hypothetical protein
MKNSSLNEKISFSDELFQHNNRVDVIQELEQRNIMELTLPFGKQI